MQECVFLQIRKLITCHLEIRACDPNILSTSRWTNLARPVGNVSEHSREFLALSNPCLADLNRIRWSCSWFLRDDFVICDYDLIPKGVKLVILSGWQIQISKWTENVGQQIVLCWGQGDRELVVEFHILIIHENAHHWRNSGQSADWHSGSAGFFILWDHGQGMKGFHPQRVHMLLQLGHCHHHPLKGLRMWQ